MRSPWSWGCRCQGGRRPSCTTREGQGVRTRRLYRVKARCEGAPWAVLLCPLGAGTSLTYPSISPFALVPLCGLWVSWSVGACAFLPCPLGGLVVGAWVSLFIPNLLGASALRLSLFLLISKPIWAASPFWDRPRGLNRQPAYRAAVGSA